MNYGPSNYMLYKTCSVHTLFKFRFGCGIPAMFFYISYLNTYFHKWNE
jgi:hypothetical protein